MADLGWYLDAASDVAAISAAFGHIPEAIDAVSNAVSAFKSLGDADASGTLRAVARMAASIEAAVDALRALATTAPSALWPSPLNSSSFWSSFPEELLQYLLHRNIERRAPMVFALLRLIGVLTE